MPQSVVPSEFFFRKGHLNTSSQQAPQPDFALGLPRPKLSIYNLSGAKSLVEPVLKGALLGSSDNAERFHCGISPVKVLGDRKRHPEMEPKSLLACALSGVTHEWRGLLPEKPAPLNSSAIKQWLSRPCLSLEK